jgi:SAM-dependent methyltransferase
MEIPKSCIKYINLQRTGYKDPVYDFTRAMQYEYEMIKPFLPKKCNTILDIGAGLGGIDILLSKHFNNPKIYLFDRDYENVKVVYGYNRGESFYNSFKATTELMAANKIKNYELLNAENGYPDLKGIDLIISLLSWGYHYKVETYINEVFNSLKPGGRLILDIRENTDGVQIIKKKNFSHLLKIQHYNKAYRMCCIK